MRLVLAAAALVGLTHGATWPVSVLMIVVASITIIAVLATREAAPIVAKRSTPRAAQGLGLERQEAMVRDFTH